MKIPNGSEITEFIRAYTVLKAEEVRLREIGIKAYLAVYVYDPEKDYTNWEEEDSDNETVSLEWYLDKDNLTLEYSPAAKPPGVYRANGVILETFETIKEVERFLQ